MKKYLITYLDRNGSHKHYVDEAYDNLWILAQVASGTDASTTSVAAEFLDKMFDNNSEKKDFLLKRNEVKKHLDKVRGLVCGEQILMIFDIREQKAVWELEGEFHK